jgi:predicted nucleotidyltransferase
MSLGENLLQKNRPISSETYVSDIRKIVQKLKTIDSNIKIFLFGSVATNTATTYSDLDIAVVSKDTESKKNIQKKFFELKRVTECSVDLVFLTTNQTINDVDHPIAQVVKSEGIEIYPAWNFKYGQ